MIIMIPGPCCRLHGEFDVKSKLRRQQQFCV